MILATTNGGVNWKRQSSGTYANLYPVCFVDAGNSGMIWATSDGGETWEPQFDTQALDSSTSNRTSIDTDK